MSTEIEEAISPRPDPATQAPMHALLFARECAREAASVEDAPQVSQEEWRAFDVKLLREQLDALLISRGVDLGLDALQRAGCFTYWIPQIDEMVGISDGEWRHKDVWKHTIQVVRQAVPRLEVRWGALLHDIGKPKTRRIEAGRVTFHGHAELGARMFKRTLASRLAFEGHLRDRVHFLILYHLRPGQYEASWTDSAVRRFYKQMGDGLTDLLDLGRADITTKRPEKRRHGVLNIANLKKRIDDVRAGDDKPVALPKGLGTVLMKELQIPPSKQLGNVITQLTEAVEAGELEGQEDFAVYVEFVRAHRERFGV